MPELPEVETVVRQIGPQLAGLRVRSVRLHTPHLLCRRDLPLEILQGARFVEVRRRGKFIRCRLATRNRGAPRPGSPEIELLVHLRMTGRLTIVPRGTPRDRHDHIDAGGRPNAALPRRAEVRPLVAPAGRAGRSLAAAGAPGPRAAGDLPRAVPAAALGAATTDQGPAA
ncbi:MAG: hypothetical protein GWP05_09375 [Anaerolineaceae bacterium]|nr:hypothetical protein [Anaerolineaceae bacterium]